MKLPRGYCERTSRSVKVVFLATWPAQRSCLLGALYQFAKEKTNSAAWIALLAGPQRFFQSSCRSTSLESSGAQRASKERAWSDTSIFKLIYLPRKIGRCAKFLQRGSRPVYLVGERERPLLRLFKSSIRLVRHFHYTQPFVNPFRLFCRSTPVLSLHSTQRASKKRTWLDTWTWKMICLWKIGIFSKSVHGVFSSLSAMIRWHANLSASVRHQPFLIPVSPTASRHSRRSAGSPLVYCRAPLIFRAVSVSGRGNGVFDDDDCDDHQYSVFVHLFREWQSPQIIPTYTPPHSKLALYPNFYQRNLVYTFPRKLQTSVLSLSAIQAPLLLDRHPRFNLVSFRRQDWARSVSSSNASDFF